MDKINNILYKIKTLFTANQRSSAGSNSTPLKLVFQNLPRIFSKKGFAFKPLSLFIIINGRCNLACRMCDVGQKVKDSMFYKNMIEGDFDFIKFNNLINEVKTFKPFISITSTEPLLYSNIIDVVKLVKKNGMEMNITTNGTLLKKYAKELVINDLDKITISIDGPHHIHDEVRGVKGTFNKIINGINEIDYWKKKLNKKYPIILINSTICDINYDHLDELFDSLPWNKIKRVGLMPMIFLTQELAEKHNKIYGDKYPATSTCLQGGINIKNIDYNKLFLKVKKIKNEYKSKIHLYFKNNINYLKTYFEYPEVFLGNKNCLFPWFAAQINAKGDLLGLTRCYNVNLGNIFDQGFLKAWNGNKIREFRMDLKKHGSFTACSRCEGVLSN